MRQLVSIRSGHHLPSDHVLPLVDMLARPLRDTHNLACKACRACLSFHSCAVDKPVREYQVVRLWTLILSYCSTMNWRRWLHGVRHYARNTFHLLITGRERATLKSFGFVWFFNTQEWQYKPIKIKFGTIQCTMGLLSHAKFDPDRGRDMVHSGDSKLENLINRGFWHFSAVFRPARSTVQYTD